MISTQIAKSGLFRFTVCPFPAFITMAASLAIVSSRWMLLLFLDLYITQNWNEKKFQILRKKSALTAGNNKEFVHTGHWSLHRKCLNISAFPQISTPSHKCPSYWPKFKKRPPYPLSYGRMLSNKGCIVLVVFNHKQVIIDSFKHCTLTIAMDGREVPLFIAWSLANLAQQV